MPRLRLQEGFDPVLVEKVEIAVPQNFIGTCDIAEPTTGLEAKFNLTQNVALSLRDKVDGSLGLYMDDSVEVEGATALRAKAGVEGQPEFNSSYSEIAVHMKDG